MDQIIYAVDISTLVLATFSIGMVIGSVFAKRLYGVAAVFAVIFGLNASKPVFGLRYDDTVFPSFVLAPFMLGFAIGNYMETRHREVRDIMMRVYAELSSLKNNVNNCNKNK